MNIANVLPIDLQAGHSVLTGQSWYARNPEDLKEIPAFSEEQFFQVSAIFQEIWGLGPKTSIPSLVHQEVQKTSFSTLNTFNPLALQRLEGKVDTLLKTMENSNKMKNPIPFPLSIEQVYIMTQSLTQIYGPEAKFREKQVEILWSCMRNQDQLLIAPAGFGKSGLIFLLAALQKKTTIVYVVPLFALLEDLIERTPKCVTSSHYHPDKDESILANPPQVLFISVEAVSFKLKKLLGQLAAMGQISKIVFDEVHLLLTSEDYRPFLGEVLGIRGNLRQNRPSLLAMTASMPPELEGKFLRLFPETHVRRESANVRNVSFRVKVAENFKEMHQIIDEEVQSAKKTIIFVMTQNEAEDLGQHFSEGLYYHSKLDEKKKLEVLARWKTAKVIVATVGFGTGIDDKDTDLIVHWGGCYSEINLYQESLRGGRNGQPSRAIVVTCSTYLKKFQEQHWAWLHGYVKLTECRRQNIIGKMDGISPVPCLADGNYAPCDNCMRIQSSGISLCEFIFSQKSLICLYLFICLFYLFIYFILFYFFFGSKNMPTLTLISILANESNQSTNLKDYLPEDNHVINYDGSFFFLSSFLTYESSCLLSFFLFSFFLFFFVSLFL